METKRLGLISLLFLLPFLINAQCGTDPVSGITEINTSAQVVNSYYPGQGNPVSGALSLTVGSHDTRGNAAAFASGDLILIIQMQGADINSDNNNAYGNGIGGGPASGYLNTDLYAGRYEYSSVLSVSGSIVNLSYPLANNYYTRSFAGGSLQTYQVIRIPRHYNLTITAAGSVTCPPWNGATGGIVALDAANLLSIDGTINVSGSGFRGGGGINLTGATPGNSNGAGTLTNTDYRWNSPVTTTANLTGGAKGEGIAGTPVYVLNPGATTITTNSDEGYVNGAMGRAAPANAGGGGTDGSPVGASSENQYNSGGGGGANAGAGGQGGSGWHGGAGDANTFPTGGYGGAAFAERSIQRLVMGGGGGAGTANNSDGSNQYMSSGGTGGGIIILRARSYNGNGVLNANGADAVGVTGSGGNTDAAGGGGAGGSIIAVTRQNVSVGLNNVSATATGGKGGNMETYFDHGPGGDGGGGMIISNGAFASTNVTGGANGLTRTGSTTGTINNVFGSTAGGNGEVQALSFAPALMTAISGVSPCGVLPLTLTSFTASLNGSTVLLNWDVTDAVNFSTFEIEYSRDGSSFFRIGQLALNESQSHYQFIHSPVTAPLNYYRLKLLDADGSFKYSLTLLVRTENLISLVVYPQPARDHIIVNVSAQRTQEITLRLFNAAGSRVKESRRLLNKGNNSFTIDNLEAFSPGIYMLQTYIDGALLRSKIAIGKN